MMQPNQGERRQLCLDMQVLKERLFRAGLFETAQKMNEATQSIGYECARQFDKEDRATPRARKETR